MPANRNRNRSAKDSGPKGPTEAASGEDDIILPDITPAAVGEGDHENIVAEEEQTIVRVVEGQELPNEATFNMIVEEVASAADAEDPGVATIVQDATAEGAAAGQMIVVQADGNEQQVIGIEQLEEDSADDSPSKGGRGRRQVKKPKRFDDDEPQGNQVQIAVSEAGETKYTVVDSKATIFVNEKGELVQVADMDAAALQGAQVMEGQQIIVQEAQGDESMEEDVEQQMVAMHEEEEQQQQQIIGKGEESQGEESADNPDDPDMLTDDEPVEMDPENAPYACEDEETGCNKGFQFHVDYVEHMERVHSKKVEDLNISLKVILHAGNGRKPPTEYREYECRKQRCGFIFESKQQLEAHMKEKHKQQPRVKCTVCNKDFLKKYYLALHVKRDHLKVKDNFCPYDGCNYAHADKGAVAKHFKLRHLKVRNWQCPKCDYKAESKACITKHVKAIHDNIRDYECTFCGKAFVQKGQLSNHVIVKHTGERKHQCPQCNYRCHFTWDLERHIKYRHEKIKNHLCNECGYSSATMTEMKSHIKHRHNPNKVKKEKGPILVFWPGKETEITQGVQGIQGWEESSQKQQTLTSLVINPMDSTFL